METLVPHTLAFLQTRPTIRNLHLYEDVWANEDASANEDAWASEDAWANGDAWASEVPQSLALLDTRPTIQNPHEDAWASEDASASYFLQTFSPNRNPMTLCFVLFCRAQNAQC